MSVGIETQLESASGLYLCEGLVLVDVLQHVYNVCVTLVEVTF